ncbi:T9SS type A sorting domain-containing protein [Halosquirtibacter xylanolyticus]|uniref:glycosyl hydrolase family 18 protein n=1 Tax=Halosquirtibacter xylanolyticus TaxID=3374599 RepID=UPI0037486383|nr:T9SS type A sorting domain-containing protein [Prolixibacteraceae bacterium]
MKRVLQTIMVLLCVSQLLAQPYAQTETSKQIGKKIVGYIPSYRMGKFNPNQLDYLSDIIVFSIFPDPITGKIGIHSTVKGKAIYKNIKGGKGLKQVDLEKVITESQKRGVKVHICVGGGDYSIPFRELVKNNKESQLAKDLALFCENYDIDGVDIDWEFPKNYDDYLKMKQLLTVLHTTLSPDKISLSAAFANNRTSQPYSIKVAKDCAHMLEMINVMGYVDTFNGVKIAKDVFVNYCKIPREKVIAGVPFYTCGPRKRPTRGVPYEKLLTLAKDASVTVSPAQNSVRIGTLNYVYNGVERLKDKAKYSIKELGGLMIWELGQDVSPLDDKYSLLRAIHSEMSKSTVTPTPSSPTVVTCKVYPNPFIEYLTFNFLKKGNYKIAIFNQTGRKVNEWNPKINVPMRIRRRVSSTGGKGVYRVVITDQSGVVVLRKGLVRN